MPRDYLHKHLLATERCTPERYETRINGFVRSMLETAINVSQAHVPAHIIHDILKMGHDMLNYPIHLLPGVAESLPQLAKTYKLILITRGDLFHHENKFASSNLGDFLKDVHIVSEKRTATYKRIFSDDVNAAAMVGNSIKSDIVPALEAGATAIHVPARYEWDIDKESEPTSNPRFIKVLGFKYNQNFLTQI